MLFLFVFFVLISIILLINIFILIPNVYQIYKTEFFSKKFKFIYLLLFIIIFGIFGIWVSIYYTNITKQNNVVEDKLDNIGIKIV